MRKYIFILFILALTSCTKHEIVGQLESVGIDKVVKIDLSTNSNYLIADGKSKLEFIVRAFYEIDVTKKVNGELVTTKELFPIKNDKMEYSKYKITCSNGDVVNGLYYSTTKNAGEKITFTCTGNGITSQKPIEVNIIAPPTDIFEKIKIPVIFHVLYNKENTTYADGIKTDVLQGMIDRLNNVLAAKYDSPYSINSNIEFTLADATPTGIPLKNKGYTLDFLSFKENKEFTDYALANLVWNLDKYLNIWIYPYTSAPTASKAPKYILSSAPSIQGLNLTKVASKDDAKYTDLTEIGLNYKIQNFQATIRGTANPKFEYNVGLFFGLLATACPNDKVYTAGGNDVDYCKDTYSFQKKYPNTEKWIWNLEKVADKFQFYYNSLNIMDEYTMGNAISYEQVKRMRAVMNTCPLRMMKQN